MQQHSNNFSQYANRDFLNFKHFWALSKKPHPGLRTSSALEANHFSSSGKPVRLQRQTSSAQEVNQFGSRSKSVRLKRKTSLGISDTSSKQTSYPWSKVSPRQRLCVQFFISITQKCPFIKLQNISSPTFFEISF